jgi:ubiquinone/menaquinone biosynthesis C-methylase UbiE
LVSGSGHSISMADAQSAYATSSLLAALTLLPGGILITGQQLTAYLRDAGVSYTDAVAVVIAIRIATVGLSTALGLVMLVVHTVTMRRAKAVEHFDDIAATYDVQIPLARREALLAKKTGLMRDVLHRCEVGGRGLDVGCGQGWYVERMRTLGFDVDGIDTSRVQLEIAQERAGAPSVIQWGSALAIPADEASYDFVYTINVLHHLPSVQDQRRAFIEMTRVLRPRGILFVHEINTRNPLFRFYMGYVFPTLNCIDEGIERWLLPHRLDRYTDLNVQDLRYFTFLPDFLPEPLVRLLAPLERWLERSSWAPYSAHFMAVLRKPA